VLLTWRYRIPFLNVEIEERGRALYAWEEKIRVGEAAVQSSNFAVRRWLGAMAGPATSRVHVFAADFGHSHMHSHKP
jgi:hypothetical protein